MGIIENFKTLPKSSKRTLALGITLALVVALPLFIWSVINLTFDTRERAQEVNTLIPKLVKVLVLEFNPTLIEHGNQRLTTYLNWNNPTDLESSYIQKLKVASSNYADYQITNRVIIDTFPELNDGFSYSENTYLECLTENVNCHFPWLVNYQKIINDYQLCDKRNLDEIDEVWLWGGPWFGYWEAVMTGPDAFITNAPPILDTSCTKNLHIMGFNYERGVPEMLEDFGHRFEGTMFHVFTENNINLWTNFIKQELINPNEANCGNIHFPPNATSDYDWSNSTIVSNSCEDWLNYPNLTDAKESFSCERWGCTGLGWIEYWLSHIPNITGYIEGTWNNWWKYVLDYELAISTTPLPTSTSTASPTSTTSTSPTPTSITEATASPSPTGGGIGGPGEPNYCGGTCGSNYNCQANFFCYQGFCRNADCPIDTNCDCIIETPTPTPTLKSTMKPTASPSPKTTPTLISKSSPSSVPNPPTYSPEESAYPINNLSDTEENNNQSILVLVKYILIGLVGLLIIVFIIFRIKKSKKSIPQILPPTNI